MAKVDQWDVELAMIYDSFTITVLATLENLGFCEPGEGAIRFRRRNKPQGHSRLIQMGAGFHLITRACGIFLVIEAVKQLRHECDARQVGDGWPLLTVLAAP